MFRVFGHRLILIVILDHDSPIAPLSFSRQLAQVTEILLPSHWCEVTVIYIENYKRRNLPIGSTMTSHTGFMENLHDGLLLIEAARTGLLPKVPHRLTSKEHDLIQSGSIFIWSENDVNIKRWTDGRNWSNSRLKGRFLIYKETKTEVPMRKKTLCARTISGEKFHVICYYYEHDIPNLSKPRRSLSDVTIPPHFYFVGGENSPLLMFDPVSADSVAIPAGMDVPFVDNMKYGNKNSLKLASSPDSAIQNSSYSCTGSSRSLSPLPLFPKSSKLPPLNTLDGSPERRFKIDEDYIKILQSAIF